MPKSCSVSNAFPISSWIRICLLPSMQTSWLKRSSNIRSLLWLVKPVPVKLRNYHKSPCWQVEAWLVWLDIPSHVVWLHVAYHSVLQKKLARNWVNQFPLKSVLMNRARRIRLSVWWRMVFYWQSWPMTGSWPNTTPSLLMKPMNARWISISSWVISSSCCRVVKI